MSRYNAGDLVSGKYRIVRLIGDGGMGVVYEARHEVLGSSVALKFLHADLAKRPGLTQRFLQEARVSATIQSAHVTHVTDVDTDQDGSPYLVMELLSGQSLQAMMDQLGRLPVDQTVDFSLQILAGLEAAHALGVVHRDMKPDNVFVTPTGGGPLLKLIDFGIAKLRASSEYTKGLTRAGVVMGTPEYMAPEQLVSAHTTDLRADIYSVGVMMFEMLAGCRPADGDDAEVIIAAVEGGRVRRLKQLMPELPDGLVALVERAMLPNRDQRFESASTMRLSLAPFAGHLSHAGRLAATAEPLAPLPTPMSSVLLSLPQSSAPPPAGSSPPPSAVGVPRTLPPDGPPLSVSQLGAARTSLSEALPVMSPLPAATAMGGPAFPPYSPSGLPAAPAHAPARSARSGVLISLLVLAVVAGGGAVGYAAYRAADDRRVVVPPLPDVSIAPTGTLRVEPLNPDVRPELPRATPTTTPTTKSPSGAKPSTPTPADTGVNNPGQVVVGSGGRSSTIQLPFPIPSTIQIPTALPSGIQLPPGISFPPGFPGIPQQPPATSPTSTSPAPTTPPATTPAPTTAPQAPPTTETPKRPIPSTKP